MTQLVADEVQLKIMVEPVFKDSVENVLNEHGANLKTGVTRLLEWFLRQPASVRAAVISKHGNPGEEIWKIHQSRLGHDAGPPATIEEAAAIIRAMAARIEELAGGGGVGGKRLTGAPGLPDKLIPDAMKAAGKGKR